MYFKIISMNNLDRTCHNWLLVLTEYWSEGKRASQSWQLLTSQPSKAVWFESACKVIWSKRQSLIKFYLRFLQRSQKRCYLKWSEYPKGWPKKTGSSWLNLPRLHCWRSPSSWCHWLHMRWKWDKVQAIRSTLRSWGIKQPSLKSKTYQAAVG